MSSSFRAAISLQSQADLKQTPEAQRALAPFKQTEQSKYFSTYERR